MSYNANDVIFEKVLSFNMKIQLKHVNMGILMLFALQLFGCNHVKPPPTNELVVGCEQQKITYADHKEQTQQQVKPWMEDEASGYPSLCNTLKMILKDRCPIGTPVPLTLINGKYLKGEPPVLEHDPEKLKKAYFDAWKDKNSHYIHKKTFEDIAPLCE